MKQKQFGKESNDGSKVDQSDTKKNKSSNSTPIDPDAVIPSRKGGKKATLSPVMQVMKAAASAAINPPKSKAPKVPSGPSSQRNNEYREDIEDGRSAEKSGVTKSKFKNG